MALTQVKSDGIADGAVTTNDLSNSGVTAGTYGSSSAIPAITVDAKGRITAASTNAISVESDRIFEGNTSAEAVDTGSDGHFKVITEGTERLRIDSSGRLGIGTSSPGDYWYQGNQFVVANTGGNAGATFAASTTGVSSLFFADGTTGTEARRGVVAYYHSDDSMRFNTNGDNERLRIDSSGNVGIGTSNPSALLTLRQGNPSLRIETSSDGGQCTIDFANESAAVAFKTGYRDANVTYNICPGSSLASSDGLHVDSSGRVGVGTTSPTKQLHVSGTGQQNILIGSTDAGGALLVLDGDANGDASGGDYAYLWHTTAGDLAIANGKSGVITFKGTSDAEKARIDSSGRVGIGTTSPGSFNADLNKLVVGGGSGSEGILVYSGTSSTGNIAFHDNADTSFSGMIRYDHSSNAMSFWTNGVNERMMINSAGQLHNFSVNSVHYLRSGASATGTDYYLQGFYGATSFTNGTESFRVTTNGDVKNTNNSYGSLSDIKLKENIVDASSQWDDLKALKVRKYNFKEGQTHTQIGLVAQEVELVSPGLVSESPDRDEDGNDLGTVTKSVNYSVLYMKAVKALQEAMERIETLEAKVAALESA